MKKKSLVFTAEITANSIEEIAFELEMAIESIRGGCTEASGSLRVEGLRYEVKEKPMKDPYDMNQSEFFAYLQENTTPEAIFKNAVGNSGAIYSFIQKLFKLPVGDADSVMREWTFQWWEEKTGRSYNEIYQKWLNS